MYESTISDIEAPFTHIPVQVSVSAWQKKTPENCLDFSSPLSCWINSDAIPNSNS